MLLNIVIMAVFGGICAAIAHERGRSPIGWFVVGAIFSCLGLILLLVLPNLKQQEAQHSRMRSENRRLRERLRKERMVSDERHAATNQRLAVHDEALGVDTIGADEERATIETGQIDSEMAPPPTPVVDDGTEWYYLEGQSRIGPVRMVDMQRLWGDRRISTETLVWSADMNDWAALRSVENLRKALGA